MSELKRGPGRPKGSGPTPGSFKAPEVVWPKIDDLSTIAPVNRNGNPDFYNHVPTRFVTKEEAIYRKWPYFYIGAPCPRGHLAPRMVSNPSTCVDCKRIREGRATIGGKGEGYEPHGGGRPPKPAWDKGPTRNQSGGGGNMNEPDPIEKRFLKVYAEKRDFAAAALECGKTMAYFQAVLSYSKPFRDAVTFMEEQYGMSHTLSLTDDFDWTDDKRVVLINVYINTGDLAEALRVTGCSNRHYLQELQDNPEFASAMERAQEIALQMLDREAISRALKGDSRLLQRVLEAKVPEYRQRLDLNVTAAKLSDAQINERIAQLCTKHSISVDDALEGEFVEHDAGRALAAPGAVGSEGPARSTESNLDLL